MKSITLALSVLALAIHCFAVPASDNTFSINQPDGNSIEVRYVGDEKFHVLETEDGFIIQKDALGYYSYVDNSGKASGVYARDALDRSDADNRFLAGLDPDRIYKLLADEALPDEELGEYRVPNFLDPNALTVVPSSKGGIARAKYSKGSTRGLVVLVQFSDVKFKRSDPQQFYTDLMNKEGFNEYANHGSVRDYFVQNSMGQFTPVFDVFGPVTVSGTRNFYCGDSADTYKFKAARKILAESIDSLVKRESIDFSMYDSDKDGYVDIMLMVYAGVGSSDSPVKASIWPHKGGLGAMGYAKAGKMANNNTYVNAYACSNEISGSAYSSDKNTSVVSGIGTIVHELSHVLGLPDTYDTKNKNPRKTPNKWDVMAQGVYNCEKNSFRTSCCTPPFYSAYERWALGWLELTPFTQTGTVKLSKIDDNVTYRVSSPNNSRDMYLLEYRSRKSWDAALLNSGMLIWHVDVVDSIWLRNIVNTDSNHMYLDIIEAVPETHKYAAATDPFPGTGNVTSFNKFVFWDGSKSDISLTDITESEDREYITFVVSGTVSSSSVASSSSSAAASSSSVYKWSSSSVQSSSSSVYWWPFSFGLNSSSSGIVSSSSSEFVSSSSVSSSSISSSSSEEVLSSSGLAYSSSEIALSSSDVALSSSEIVSSSSESVLSSSEVALSSSEESSSSSDVALSSSTVESSSSEVVSSSSEVVSSSAVESSSSEPESSSSEVLLSSSAEIVSSSSEEVLSSSSTFIVSSSSDGFVSIAFKNPSLDVQVSSQNGSVYVYAPQQGAKTVRIFSPIGSLLLERPMDGFELVIDDLHRIGKSSLILSVSQGRKQLFTGVVRGFAP